MGKTKLITMLSITVIVAIATAPLSVAEAGSCCSGDGQKPVMGRAKPVAAAALSLEEIYSGRLPMVSQFIDNAVKAVASGDKKTALAELDKAKQMMAGINEAIGRLVKPGFANIRCPIMGSPVNPDKVTEALTRDYKGRKIALCCGQCPAKWDKLTDAKKDAKLAEVAKPAPGKKCSR